jgi:hypothetical protein
MLEDHLLDSIARGDAVDARREWAGWRIGATVLIL